MKPELFREGSSDENVYKSVVENNEYRLGDSFEPDDIILDIGAHIGSFAYACLKRGAKHIMCFEPDPDNFHLLRQHLADYIKDGSVEAFPVAIIGGMGVELRSFSGVVKYNGEMNHGGGFLLGHQDDDYGLGQYIVNPITRVVCIGLDQILRYDVRLMKIDAEGSEHDMIYGSCLMPHVKEVVGEYHPYGGSTYETLRFDLNTQGFTTEILPHPNSDLGLFFSKR